MVYVIRSDMLGAVHLRPDAKLASLTKRTVEAPRFLQGTNKKAASDAAFLLVPPVGHARCGLAPLLLANAKLAYAR